MMALLLPGGAARADSLKQDPGFNAFVEQVARKLDGTKDAVAARLQRARLARDPQAELTALRDIFVLDAFLPEQDRTSEAYLSIQPGFDVAISMAKQLHDDNALAIFYGLRAYSEADRDWPRSNHYAKQAFELAENRHLWSLPYLYELDAGRLTDFDDTTALVSAEKSYRLFEQQGNKLMMATTLTLMARILRTHQTASAAELDKSMAYLKKAQQITAGTDYKVLSSRIKGNIGLALQAAQEYEAAAAQFESALEDAGGQVDSAHIPYYLYYLGATDIKLGLYTSAEARLKSSLTAFTERKDKIFMTLSLIGLAEVQSRLGFHHASMAMLAQARPEIALTSSLRLIVRYHRAAAEAYARMKDYPAAYRATMELVAAEHALALAGSKKRVQELTVKFDVKVKDGENALLIAERAQLESRKTLLMLALLFGAILLGAIAVLLALQVRQKRRFAVLALRDELTGAPNRRHIIELAGTEVKTARQYGREVWLSILDIDHFKRINDEFGHEAGDAVLKMFYACCAGALRKSDALGRIGGEEFLLVSVGVLQEDIFALYERLLAAVKLIQVPGAPAGYALGFSMGTCSSRNSKLDVKSIIKHADDALYQAKQSGRARCRASGADLPDQAALW